MQQQLKEGLKAGRWRTAEQVATWLQEAYGIKRAAKSIYRWLGKAGGALRVPRPCHVQQDPLATAAFRAELEERLEKLALPKTQPKFCRSFITGFMLNGKHGNNQRRMYFITAWVRERTCSFS